MDESSMAKGQVRRSFRRSFTELYFFRSPFFKDPLKQKFRDSSFWKIMIIAYKKKYKEVSWPAVELILQL